MLLITLTGKSDSMACIVLVFTTWDTVIRSKEIGRTATVQQRREARLLA